MPLLKRAETEGASTAREATIASASQGSNSPATASTAKVSLICDNSSL